MSATEIAKRVIERTAIYKDTIMRIQKQILEEEASATEYYTIIAKLQPYTTQETPFYYKISGIISELKEIAEQEKQHKEKLKAIQKTLYERI